MIRTCPTCGDFCADGPVAFCPADGTPLANVDPHGDAWAEASRAVEEKERVLRTRTRRLRLRRVMVLTTTMLITTLLVLVVAVNTYVYLAPQPDAPVVAAALTPTPTPTRSESPAWTPTPDTPSSLPFVPAVTPTPTPEATPTPDRVRNPSGPADADDTSTPTPTPTATPIVTETPVVTETPTEGTPTVRDEPPPRSPTPTPTPTPDRRRELVEPTPPRPSRPPEESAQTSDHAPGPAPQCKGDDRKRLKRYLVTRFEAAWVRAIREDRSAVSRQYAPHGAERPEAELLPPVAYEVEVSEACAPVFVRAKYKWRISWHGGPPFRSCTKRKDGQKTFPCMKVEAEWRCA